MRTDDPSLKLTYSADWDDALSPWQWGGSGLPIGTENLATQVSFASELDSIGIDEYAPISDAANPTLAQLIAGWTKTPTDPTTRAVTGNQSLISYFESVAAQIGNPLLFTELGYESASDAASQPSGSATNVFDPVLQANLYQAFFQAWQQAGNFSLTGVYFWNWDPNAAEVGPGNGANFSPQSLPAQAVATQFFGSNIVPPPPSTPTLPRASDSGVQGDDITDVTTPTIIGFGQAGDTVTLNDGAAAVGSTTVAGNGTWSIVTTPLALGAHSLTASQTGGTGNVSAASSALSLSIVQSPAINDVNGDTMSDIVLQNDSGQVGFWEMNGFNMIAAGNSGNPGAAVHAIGAADFTGDGKSDVFFQAASGQVSAWQMNGLNITTSNNQANPGTSWHVVS